MEKQIRSISASRPLVSINRSSRSSKFVLWHTCVAIKEHSCWQASSFMVWFYFVICPVTAKTPSVTLSCLIVFPILLFILHVCIMHMWSVCMPLLGVQKRMSGILLHYLHSYSLRQDLLLVLNQGQQPAGLYDSLSFILPRTQVRGKPSATLDFLHYYKGFKITTSCLSKYFSQSLFQAQEWTLNDSITWVNRVHIGTWVHIP